MEGGAGEKIGFNIVGEGVMVFWKRPPSIRHEEGDNKFSPLPPTTKTTVTKVETVTLRAQSLEPSPCPRIQISCF